jgi:hypothetical protein
VRSWHRGLEAARKYNTLYEEGLIRARLASLSKDKPAERKEHAEKALQIFEKMGAANELRLVRDIVVE